MKPINRYQRTMRRLSTISLVSNACGAALIVFYFSNMQWNTGAETLMSTGLSMGLAVLSVIILVAAANRFSTRQQAMMLAWYRQAAENAPAQPPSLSIQRQALNLPAGSAITTFVMWCLASLGFGALNSIGLQAGQFNWAVLAQVLVGGIVIAGPVTAILNYFLVERAWKSELPLFFAEGELVKTPAFRLTVRMRLLVFFAVGAIPMLLLATLSYGYAVQIAHSPQPTQYLPNLLGLEILTTVAGIAAAIVLARTSGATLVEALETLSQRMTAVQAGKLDEHITVSSNDEIGIASTHFNSMALSLKQRDTELKTIYQISQDITANLELDPTLQSVLEQVQRMIAYNAAEICLYDEKENVLRARAWAGPNGIVADTSGASYPLDKGYTGWIGQKRASLLVSDVDSHQAQQPLARHVAEGIKLNSYLGVPLIANQKLVGTLELVSAQKAAFDEHTQQLLETIAPQAAIAIQNAAQVIERERSLKEQIEQLRIEIDEVKKAKQVAEITGTEYFQDLQQKAKQIRSKKNP